MMVWAAIGKPNQREWVPGGRARTPKTTACIPPATICSHATGAESRARHAGKTRRRAAAGDSPRVPPPYDVGPPLEGLDPAGVRCRHLVRRPAPPRITELLASDDVEKAARGARASSIAA